jgi:hypothetical protein
LLEGFRIALENIDSVIEKSELVKMEMKLEKL